MAARMIERARTRISPGTPVVVTWLGAAAAATALSVAACTSSQRAVDTRFVAKANAICAQAVARHSGHPSPYRASTPCIRALPIFRQSADTSPGTEVQARRPRGCTRSPPRRHFSASGRNCAPSSIKRPPTRGGRSRSPNAPTSPDSSRPCAPRGTCRRRSTESPPGSGSRLHRRAVNSSAELPLAAYRPPISTKEHVDR